MPRRENIYEVETPGEDGFAEPPEEDSSAEETEVAGQETELDDSDTDADSDEAAAPQPRLQLNPNLYALQYLDIDPTNGKIVKLNLYRSLDRDNLTPTQRTDLIVIVQSLVVYLQQLANSDNESYIYGGPAFFSLNTALTYYLRELDYLQQYQGGNVITSFSYRPIYYYLGYVVQAIVFSLGYELNKDGEIYRKEHPLKVKWNLLTKETPFVFNPKLSSLEGIDAFEIRNNNQIVKSIFEIPVSIEEVDALLADKNTSNLSVVDIIQEILGLVKNQQEFSDISLGIRFLPNDPSVMEIYEMGNKDNIDSVYADIFDAQDNFTEEGFNKSFIINYGEKNSLVENINVTAKVDPNVLNSFRLPVNLGSLNIDLFAVLRDNPELQTTFGSIISSPIYKSAINAGKIDSEVFGPNVVGGENQNIRIDEENFQEVFDGFAALESSGTLTDSQRNDFNKFVGEVAYLSYDLQQILINIATSQNSNFASTLLQTFLLKVDTTIHGTAGLGSFDHAVIRNYLPGTTGLYTITSIEDILSDKGFSTLLQMNLIRAVGAGGE